ncbi:MAG: PAS domain S-box protein [Verrucomicrobia bacterium]|nr:PAS domain S-box protein [Verrucomicrobiota bacterium]
MRKVIRQLFTGLRLRLLLLVLLACAPLVGLTLHTASAERRELVKDWKQRSQAMMGLATREEGQVIGQTRQLLLALAESAAVRSGNRRSCQKVLDDLFTSYPRYANLGVVQTNGIVLASARPLGQSGNQTDRPFFRRTLATRAFAIGDFPDGQAGSKPAVHFGCPVFDSTGQIQAVVFAALDLDWISRFESALPAQLPKGATWTEVDRSGRILVRYPAPEQWIGRPFPEPSLLKTAFAHDRGVLEVVSADGIPGYHAFAVMHSQLVPDTVVTILGSIPTQVLFAGADRRLTDNLTGLGIAAGLAFVFSWIGSYLLILRPVRVLVKSSAQLATGEFTTRTGLAHRGDELGQLTRTFDEMAQALEHREGERRSADQALKGSEMRYRRLFEAAQDGILILNADTGKIDDVNPFLTDLLGYSREQLLGNRLWEIGPFKDTSASKAEFRELQREGCVRYDDLPLETRAGQAINVEFVSNVYQVNGSRVIQCNIRNITERKQAEAKRKEYSRKLQGLSRRLVAAQETERRNLARELHDEIGQALTVMQLNLQAMLQAPATDALTPRLTESLAVVERVLEQVQDISLNLRPSVLDDLGLEPALRWYTDRQAALVGLQVEFHADRLAQRLDPVIETECFRVAQEALTNVVRHAKAKTVTVELRQEAGQLHLRVRDDGIGFEVPAVREKAVRGASLGLLGMEERAALAGGGLEFTSRNQQGTEVHAWFPLKWQTPPCEAKTP